MTISARERLSRGHPDEHRRRGPRCLVAIALFAALISGAPAPVTPAPAPTTKGDKPAAAPAPKTARPTAAAPAPTAPAPKAAGAAAGAPSPTTPAAKAAGSAAAPAPTTPAAKAAGSAGAPAAATPATPAVPQGLRPYESDTRFIPANPIDVAVLATLKKRGIQPANLCSDEVFVRRVFIDAIGTVPTPEEVRAFMADTRANKRAALVDALLAREEFADYWSLKWCDVLRVKAEFPINLWPNAVQAYHRWVRDAIRENRPYDRFARELLTSSGSNFRVPQVNFYRAIQGHEPPTVAAAVALTLMGARIDKWPADRRAGMTALFSRVSYKKTGEWKEEIVEMDPAPGKPLDAMFPDGTKIRIPDGQDPRRVFADWLLKPGNPWFARCAANRIWTWLFGRGIIHEPEDIRPDNPPVHPAVLAYLEKELVGARYDLRHLYRLILNSRTYQGSSIPKSKHPQAGALFAHYQVRRLDAEVLIDALSWIGETGENYSSAIPEPFTFIPSTNRSITLADGSITSTFLEMFGRPTRDSGLESERNNEPTDAQRLYLLNSSDIQRKVERSPRLRAAVESAKGNRAQAIRSIYLILLSREPTPAELAAAEAYMQAARMGQKQAADDLAWALVNSKEFLYRH